MQLSRKSDERKLKSPLHRSWIAMRYARVLRRSQDGVGVRVCSVWNIRSCRCRRGGIRAHDSSQQHGIDGRSITVNSRAKCSVRSVSRGSQYLRSLLAIDVPIIVATIILRITYDIAKRASTLQERGLDFEDALEVFSGLTAEVEDTRKNYGETRIICFGHLRGRMVQVVYAPRDAGRHIISMRKANAREKARFSPLSRL